MSPEQASRASIDHRSDIFSLGVVLYEITVGKRLFKGPAHEVVKKLTDGVVEPPTFTRRDFPGQLEGIIMRALERHPENRYQSAYDLADDLEGFLRDARMTSGPVRIARYLDELAEAAGGARRPELISERDKAKAAGAEDEELEFDEQWSDGHRPAEEESWSEWDEYNEPDAEVAAALGLDLDQLRLMRTPVPHRDGDVIRLPLPAPVSESSPTAVVSEGDESVPVIVAPPMTASGVYPMPQAQIQQVPVVPAPAAPSAGNVLPARVPPSTFLPWLVLGTCAGIAIGILASQLL
jgi:hypothetical protein